MILYFPMDRVAYKSGYKYQLAESYTISIPIHGISAKTRYITLTPTGELTIKSGYAWDGPSGPTFDTENTIRGSLVHDALYQLIRLGFIPHHLRQKTDQIMHTILLQDGMSRIRAWLWYKGLRIGGRSSTLPSRIKQIKYAP